MLVITHFANIIAYYFSQYQSVIHWYHIKILAQEKAPK